VRAKGSAGGQNGVKNIIYHLNSDLFPRVKIGIGAKPHPDYDLADWVLSKFSAEELPVLHQTALRAMEAAAEIIANGTASAAQKFNGH
ncbi:MAG: aminoacyl-tRNA hydrolase, partial [Butyricicoccus sp.]